MRRVMKLLFHSSGLMLVWLSSWSLAVDEEVWLCLGVVRFGWSRGKRWRKRRRVCGVGGGGVVGLVG